MDSFIEASPYITTIFIIILSVVFLTRMVFAIILHFARQNYLVIKESILKKKKGPKYEKEEDELLKQIPKAHSATRAANLARIKISEQQNDSYELVESEEQQQEKAELSEVKIVDTVKPVGFWSSMILGQKLSYLVKSAQIINKRGKQGFWVSMIEAQEQAAGKQHGRQR
jgi:hypothetical protein